MLFYIDKKYLFQFEYKPSKIIQDRGPYFKDHFPLKLDHVKVTINYMKTFN